MSIGTICKSLAAVRREPNETSEMVNQLLFGETFDIVETYKGWERIVGHLDGYHGWIDSRLASIISEEQNKLSNYKLANTLFTANNSENEYPLHLCPGSVLYNFNNNEFENGGLHYKSIETPITSISDKIENAVIELAKRYINAPYLWGGRSPFGVDCSGLVQVVYRLVGINLPRDASQQAAIGNTIEFITHVKPGDLAYFENEEGLITHVGIITENSQIIHSSGFVRIDKFDHQGIFNVKANKYTHKLRVIKRVINT